jgi:signal transduction histidine kinase
VIRIGYETENLTVTVTDDGVGTAPRGLPPRGLPPEIRCPDPPAPDDLTSGSGISGMLARAEAVGGFAVAGPGPDGGFQVRASLPLRNEAP